MWSASERVFSARLEPFAVFIRLVPLGIPAVFVVAMTCMLVSPLFGIDGISGSVMVVAAGISLIFALPLVWKMRLYISWSSLFVTAFLIAYLSVLLYYRGFNEDMLSGSDFDIGTYIWWLACGAVFIAWYLMVRATNSVQAALWSLGVGTAVPGVFLVLSFLAVSEAEHPLSLFCSIGLGFCISTALILMARTRTEVLCACVMWGISAVGLVLCPLPIAISACAAALGIVFTNWFLTRASRLIGVACLVLCVCCAAFLNSRFDTLPVRLLTEVRPSAQATLHSVLLSYADSAENALLGRGPGSFARMWDAYRPLSVNESPYWRTEIDRGYSALLMFAAELGMFSLLLILLGISYVIAYTLLVLRSDLPLEKKYVVGVCAILGTYILGVCAVYVPEPIFVLPAAAFFGSWFTQIRGEFHAVPLVPTVSIPILLCAGFALIFVGTLRGYSLYEFDAGIEAFAANDLKSAYGHFETSIATDASSETARVYAEIRLVEVQEYMNKKTQFSEDDAAYIAQSLEKAEETVERGLNADPYDFRNALVFGKIKFASWQLFKDDVKKQEAGDRFGTASDITGPQNPESLFFEALYAAVGGDVTYARALLQHVLLLRPGYIEALELLTEIDRVERRGLVAE